MASPASYNATSINADITFIYAPYQPAPIPIEGFEVENLFEVDEVLNVDVEIGLGGNLNSWISNKLVEFKLHLFPDSISVTLLDLISFQQTQTKVPGSGVIVVSAPSIKKVITYPNVLLLNAFSGFRFSTKIENRTYTFKSNLPIVATLGVTV